MKRQVFLLILVSIIFFLSCSHHSNRTIEFKGKGLYVIDLDNATINREDVFLYSNLYKGIKTILLETNESCLIGNINKMRVFDQFIFILDTRIAKSLYAFDKDGRFIRKIGNVGGGPGEYVSPFDFTIDKDNKTIYVLDSQTERINKYDLTTGRFIHAINLERGGVRSHNIEHVGGKLYADAYFRNHSDDNYLLRVIQEPSGKEDIHFLNVTEYNKGISNTNVIQNNVFHLLENGNAVFVQWYMNHIIEITGDSIFPLIDIKSKDVLTSGEIKTAMEKDPLRYMMELMQLNKYYQIQNFIEHGDLIHFDYFKGMGLIKILFDKRTNEVRIIQSALWNDLLIKERGYSVSSPVFGCYDSVGAYFYLSSANSRNNALSRIKAAANAGALSPDLNRLEDLKNLDEDANPVIFYYEFKD